jgi:hypothetical protein
MRGAYSVKLNVNANELQTVPYYVTQ